MFAALSGAAGAAPVRLVAERGYEVTFEGAEGDLLAKLKEVSDLVAQESEPPTTIGGLRRRAEADIERMRKVLQSRGLFEGTVAYEIDFGRRRVAQLDAPEEDDEGTQTDAQPEPVPEGDRDGPVEVTVFVTPGPQYTIGSTKVVYVDTSAETSELPQDLGSFGAGTGNKALAADILSAEQKLQKDLRNQGFPYAKAASRKALANVEDNTLNVTTQVRLGARATFGDLTIKGTERVNPAYIERRLAWEEGEEYDAGKVQETRNALVGSGLFNAVRFDPAQEVSADGSLPMTVTVAERPPRTIGGGVSYSSTEGFGIKGLWEHRNLLGEGQHLRLEAQLSQIEQSLTTTYEVSGFRRPDQTLRLSLEAGREETDVYKRLGTVISAGIERPIADRWTGSAALLFDVARVDEEGEPQDTSYLVGLRGGADYDGSDSLLNPTEGTRLMLGATPYAGYFNGPLSFLKTDAEVRHYLPLDDDKEFVLATRAKLGSIIGARTGELPADKRFYAGGAGSIRGFEYQDVGPIGEDGTPEGGRSLAEINAELRWRFADNYGLVPFVDGGTVSDFIVPKFDEEFAWAGGLGFRYYTDFGPIGVDVAYPISTPSDEDPSIQFYVKLGQAF